MFRSLLRTLIIALSCIGLGACAVTSESTQLKKISDVPTVGLSAQKLEQGKCGIFLWEETQGRPLVFFQKSELSRATVHVKGRVFEVKRLAAEKEIVTGLFSRQFFSNAHMTLNLKLQVDPGSNLVEGIRIPNGVMTITELSGAQEFIAVSGLFACKV